MILGFITSTAAISTSTSVYCCMHVLCAFNGNVHVKRVASMRVLGEIMVHVYPFLPEQKPNHEERWSANFLLLAYFFWVYLLALLLHEQVLKIGNLDTFVSKKAAEWHGI